jgi:hypothetical protein
MIPVKNKFNYQPFSRKEVDGKRLYCCPDGNTVPSVTTILDKTKDKTHLFEWKKRIGEKKAQEITQEASGIGTRMHGVIEKYIDNGEWPEPGSNPYAIQAHKMATVIKHNALRNIDEVYGSEVNLYFPKLYAGTTDLVGSYRGDLAIMDFKQANKPKKSDWIEDYYLQIVFYGMSHNEVYGTKINQGHIFMCSRDFTFQQFDIYPHEWSYWENKAWDRLEKFYQSCHD